MTKGAGSTDPDPHSSHPVSQGVVSSEHLGESPLTTRRGVFAMEDLLERTEVQPTCPDAGFITPSVGMLIYETLLRRDPMTMLDGSESM